MTLTIQVLDELTRALRAATQYFSKSFDHFEELHGKEADAVIHAHGAHPAG